MCVCVLVRCFFCGFIIALFPIPSVILGSDRVPSAPLAATSVTGTETEKHSAGSKSVNVLTKKMSVG